MSVVLLVNFEQLKPLGSLCTVTFNIHKFYVVTSQWDLD